MTKGKKAAVIIGSVVIVLAVATAALGVYMYENGNFRQIHPYTEPEDGQIKVACVGDSITYGAGIKNWKKNAYPVVLGNLLGDGYCVNNFGYIGRTAQTDADKPFTEEKLYQKSLDYNPDIVVLMLGSNDSKPYNWKGIDNFKQAYGKIIDSYINLESKPTVYIVTPPPVFPYKGDKVWYDLDSELISGDITLAAKQLAEEKGLELIDMNAVFDGRSDLLSDGAHPTAEGASLFAQVVFEAIK
ncbi:MAG: GDSL-type esterase/lipase family protein [Acutalibacteraceae bacterium]